MRIENWRIITNPRLKSLNKLYIYCKNSIEISIWLNFVKSLFWHHQSKIFLINLLLLITAKLTGAYFYLSLSLFGIISINKTLKYVI